MGYETKQEVLNRLNGVNGFIHLESDGAVVDKRAKMPLIHIIKALMEARELEPGTNCEILDYHLGPDGLELEYQEGNFKGNLVVPQNIAEFFGGKISFPEDE